MVSFGQPQVRYLARGKDPQETSLFQPQHGFLETGQVGFGGILAAKRVHVNKQVPQFVYWPQQVICQYLHILPHPSQQSRQNYSLHAPKGVIGHDHHRPPSRNAGKILRHNLVVNIKTL